MKRMFISAATGMAPFLALLMFSPTARAASPTPVVSPSATGTPAPAPTVVQMTIDLQGTRVSWSAVAGAASYQLTGDLTATETNRDGPCVAPGARDVRSIALNEMLPAGATSFDLPLPAIAPEDEWVVSARFMEIAALDASGRTVGGARSSRIVEGCQIEATPTPRAMDLRLPTTGRDQAGGGIRLAWLEVGIAALLGLSIALGGIRLRRKV